MTYILMAETFEDKYKQELTKINENLNLLKYDVMNVLTDNIPHIEKCAMMAYVKNGKMFIEITDAKTVDIIKHEMTQ